MKVTRVSARVTLMFAVAAYSPKSGIPPGKVPLSCETGSGMKLIRLLTAMNRNSVAMYGK